MFAFSNLFLIIAIAKQFRITPINTTTQLQIPLIQKFIVSSTCSPMILIQIVSRNNRKYFYRSHKCFDTVCLCCSIFLKQRKYWRFDNTISFIVYVKQSFDVGQIPDIFRMQLIAC